MDQSEIDGKMKPLKTSYVAEFEGKLFYGVCVWEGAGYSLPAPTNLLKELSVH